MKTIEIAVVGSGVAALGALKGLIENSLKNVEFKITLIYPPEHSKNEENPELVKVGQKLKSRFGSYETYDFGGFLKLNLGRGVLCFPSKSQEGFTSVWGASVGNSRDLEFLTSSVMDAEFVNKNIFVSPARSTELQKLAVSPSLCNFCGRCLFGCPNNAIWSPANSINISIKKSGASILRDYVEEIDVQGEKIEVHFQSGSRVKYDKLLLCAGALSSASILLKSKLIDSPTYLKETRMIYFLGLRTPKRFHRNSFALSTRNFIFDIPSQLTRKAYLQIYDDPRGLWYRFGFIKKVFNKKFIFDFVARFFTVSLVYLDARSSSHLKIELANSDTISITRKKNSKEFSSVLMIFLRIIFSCKRLGFLPVAFWKSKVGESFHFGSLFGSDRADSIRLEKQINHRVYVCDSNTIGDLTVGPITPLIYSNAYEVSKVMIATI